MIHWTRANKWQKHRTLIKKPGLRPYLPETAIFSKKKLITFLKKYDFVYLKPIKGTGGYGIIKVSKQNEEYLLQISHHRIVYKDVLKLYLGVSKIIRKRVYLIQQGIQLVSVKHRSIDFRLLLLKPYDKWEYIGIMGKIGAKNKIVTNHSRGGKPILLSKAMKTTLNLSDLEVEQLEAKMKAIGLEIAESLSKDYRYVREVGIDAAVDPDLNLFILETNSMPRFHLFRHHPDKTLYPKIYRYVRHIRRNYK